MLMNLLKFWGNSMKALENFFLIFEVLKNKKNFAEILNQFSWKKKRILVKISGKF